MPSESKSGWARCGWTFGLLLCLVSLGANEIVFAYHQCDDIIQWDYRWTARFSGFILIPICFAMALDAWPTDILGLAFDTNIRDPPVLFQGECVLPALMVGESINFFLYFICWIWCTPWMALFLGGLATCLLLSGVAYSKYLRQDFYFCSPAEEEEEKSEEVNVPAEQSSPDLETKRMNTARMVEATKPQPPRRFDYDEEDNVAAMMTTHRHR